MSSRKASTSESISFQSLQPHGSISYYGQVSEANIMKSLPWFPCEIDSCHCNATGLKPNTGYIVALKACIRIAPKVCSKASRTEPIYTKPERKLPCSVSDNYAMGHL